MSSIGEHIKFAPKCLYTSSEPRMMLVFEDVTEKGYKILPRDRQLNFDQALPLIIKLAKLHAASAVLYENKPSMLKTYSEGEWKQI